MQQRVDKGIPFPDSWSGGRPRKYPWAQLKIGDSFLMDNDHSATSMVNAYNFGLPKNKKIKIRTAVENGKRRVWRIK